MRKLVVLLTVILVLGLSACGTGSDTAPSEGDPQAGEQVFDNVAAPACGLCHSLQPEQTLVGPSLAGIAAEAGQMVSGQSAEEYLRNSIVDPDAFVVEGFQAGIMPSNYGSQLSEEQITDLVAYLLTLD